MSNQPIYNVTTCSYNPDLNAIRYHNKPRIFRTEKHALGYLNYLDSKGKAGYLWIKGIFWTVINTNYNSIRQQVID